VKGDDSFIDLSSKYLLEAISKIKNESVTIKCDGNLTPLYIKDGKFLHIIVGVKV
jgi:DNA polymerase III sliding clamp (beta) subunit (PCNA family)